MQLIKLKLLQVCFNLSGKTENNRSRLTLEGPVCLTAAQYGRKCSLLIFSGSGLFIGPPENRACGGRVCAVLSNCKSFRSLASHMQHIMAPASRAVVVVVLSLLYLCRAIFSSEYFSTLTLFKNELHKQGCSSLSEWEEYAADCGKFYLFAVSLPRPPRLNCHCNPASLTVYKLTITG